MGRYAERGRNPWPRREWEGGGQSSEYLGGGDAVMKLIIAVIQPPKLNTVREALAKLGVTRMTVCDAQGFARQRGQTELYRGHEYSTNLLRKISLEIVVADPLVEQVIETISNVARTGPEGTIGDGKIFILPNEEALDISSVQRGSGAL